MSKSNKKTAAFLGGAAVIAGAIALFLQNYPPAPSGATQGAIGQRQVHRDPQAAGDLKVDAGTAPVAAKALVESKEFKQLAAHPEYKSLVNSEGFRLLLANPQAMQAAANPGFSSSLLSFAKGQNAQGGLAANQSARGLEAQSNLSTSSLAQSPAFAAIARSEAFQLMLQSQAFESLVQSNLYASLLQSNAFQENLRVFQANSGASSVQ